MEIPPNVNSPIASPIASLAIETHQEREFRRKLVSLFFVSFDYPTFVFLVYLSFQQALDTS